MHAADTRLLGNEQMTAIDFSHVNLEYLIQARELAQCDPGAGALLLDIPTQLAQRLAGLTPANLARITRFKLPLVSPRLEQWWWDRLLRALNEGKPGELEVILEHAGLLGDANYMDTPGGDRA